MQVQQFIKRWKQTRRHKKETNRLQKLQQRVLDSESKLVAELRVEILKRDREIKRLRKEHNGQALEWQRKAAAAQRRFDDQKLNLDTQIKRLKSEVEIAQHENELLAAVHASDISRREAEAAIFIKKTESTPSYADAEEGIL